MNTNSNAALAAANAVLTAKGRSFHWARQLLTQEHADRATRLYGFCRRIDDLADEATDPQAAQLALAKVSRAVASGQADADADPSVLDALQLMRECGIEARVVQDLIAGVASDLHNVRMADDDALLRYCYQVAGTVGVMMCRVLDVQDAAALPHAIDLGMAMQLTNICRDIGTDAALGRRYLPASLVGDIDPTLLINPDEQLQPLLRQCVTTLLDRADTYYRSGEQGLAYLPLRARSSILAAARVYRAIGTRLRQRGNAYWLERAVVQKRTKAVITARALLAVPLRPSFWWPPHQHDARLHTALQGVLQVGNAAQQNV